MKRRVLSRLTDTFILPHNGIDLIVFPELLFILFFSTPTSNHIHSALFSLIQFFFLLTQEQHKPTMANDSKIPAVPTIHVRRRKRMTPRMFCRQGR